MLGHQVGRKPRPNTLRHVEDDSDLAALFDHGEP
jgi:hypothetical protein